MMINLHDQTLGEQKIATMVECKDFRKGIIKLQWEHRMKGMQIEHLNTKARDIQMLRLSEEQQDVSGIGTLKYCHTVVFIKDLDIFYSPSKAVFV